MAKPKNPSNDSPLYTYAVKEIKLIIKLSNGETLKYLIDPDASDLIFSTFEPEKFSFSQIMEHELKLEGRIASGSHLSHISYQDMLKFPNDIS